MTARQVGAVLGPALFVGFLALEVGRGQGADPALRVGGLACWMAVWWMTECVALHLTALLPLVLFPVLGVAKAEEIAKSYGHDLVWLFFGAFLMGAAVEARGLHRRLALLVLSRVGTSPRRLVLGFLLAAALVSSVLSNTATAVMLMPVAAAVAFKADQHPALGGPRLAAGLVLAVAYGASIGGVLTMIGTPPNAFFVQHVRKLGLDENLNFVTFSLASLPIAMFQLLVAWFVLTRGLPSARAVGAPGRAAFAAERVGHPPMRPAERRVLWVFGLAVLAWMTRAEMRFGDFVYPGWAAFLGMPGVGDSTVAVVAALALMLLPSGEGDGSVLPPAAVNTIRWDLLLVFGGGFALGDAFKSSGLADHVGGALAGIADVPTPLLLLLVCLTTTALSEVATNTPLAIAVIPVLGAGAKAAGLDPVPVLFAATLAASLGFMLPVGTAPNAVAFATGRAPVRTMIRSGFAIDLAGSAAVALGVWLWSGGLLSPGPTSGR
jgi:sodium-dependent dicarboxylate transporter 2/3/5